MVIKLLMSSRIRDEISEESMKSGFMQLMDVLEEHKKDVPLAAKYCGSFIAAAIHDKCLTTEIFEDISDPEVLTQAHACVSGAEKLPVEDIKAKLLLVLEEYLREAEIQEALDCIGPAIPPHYGHQIVMRVVILALNMKNRERELASALLARCNQSGLLSEEQMQDGFLRLVWRLPDLVLDTPDAATLLAVFAARAISDDSLSPDFLSAVPKSMLKEGSLGAAFAAKLTIYRSKQHQHFKTPGKVWGVAGNKSVSELKSAIREILSEFFACGDVNECLKSIRELEAPYFLHEIVSKAIVISLDHGTPGQLRAHLLLQTATEQGLVTGSQVAQGLERVLNSLHDVVIDVPSAPVLVARFLFQAFEDGWASRDLLEERKGGPWGENFSRGKQDASKKATYAELARLEAL